MMRICNKDGRKAELGPKSWVKWKKVAGAIFGLKKLVTSESPSVRINSVT